MFYYWRMLATFRKMMACAVILVVLPLGLAAVGESDATVGNHGATRFCTFTNSDGGLCQQLDKE
jgi:hypothetical protein